MELDMYWTGVAVLVPLAMAAVGHGVVISRWRRWRSDRLDDPGAKADNQVEASGSSALLDQEAKRFRKVFLRVYLTVMAAEWLQGPYTYSLFRHEKNLSEWTVAMLFVTYYSSAAASALVTGSLADRYGRRAACLAFCAIHSLASISALSDTVEILVAGRVFGGVALTLLWTTFESWMVTEYHARGFHQSSLSLTSMFGSMTTLNCITGILAGILGHCLVLTLGSKTDPFALGVLLNLCAALLMLRTWNENCGTTSSVDKNQDQEQSCLNEDLAEPVAEPPQPLIKSCPTFQNYKIWILSFVSCCFEGTMFLLVFFWPSALQDAHSKASLGSTEAGSIPHGVIQAAFMASMVLGAAFFNATTRYTSNIRERLLDSTVVSNFVGPRSLLCISLIVSSLGFLATALYQAELHMFCIFLLIELCSGIYIPSMAFHRSIIVSDKHRTGIYGIMKIPLFLFVVGALCTTTGSDRSEHQQRVFLLCAGLLFLAFLAAVVGLRELDVSSSGGFTKLPDEDVIQAEDEDLEGAKSFTYTIVTERTEQKTTMP